MGEPIGWHSTTYGQVLLGTGDDWFYHRGKEMGYDTLSLCIEISMEYVPPLPVVSDKADEFEAMMRVFIDEGPVALANI